MSVVAKKLTRDDIKGLPENAGRTEIVDADLVIFPTPSVRHQLTATALGAVIQPFVKRRKLGLFVSSPVHVVLDEHVNYEPDLCFLSADRLDILGDPVIGTPPDLVIEIISDLRERHIRVFASKGGRFEPLGAFGAGERVQTQMLQGLELDPAQILPD